MKKHFELVAGIVIVFFMGYVLLQLVTGSVGKPALVTPVVSEPNKPVEQKTTFQTLVTSEVKENLGQPIEGYEPDMLLTVFPNLAAEDFAGVEAAIGVYVYENGQLRHQVNGSEPVHSAAGAITSVGFETLYQNVTARLELDAETISPELVIPMLFAEDTEPSPFVDDERPISDDLVACSMDAKLCPDGSAVGRVGPNCEFPACPGESPATTESVECTPESKQVDACIEIYAPVCGLVEVQCVTTPCDPAEETFSNGCHACAQGNVLSYTEGACEALEQR